LSTDIKLRFPYHYPSSLKNQAGRRGAPTPPTALDPHQNALEEIMSSIITQPGVPAQVHPDEEPVPVCRRCGGQVGIFLDHGLDWQHFHGDGTTSGAQEIYDPGHSAEVTWRLPGEDPEEP
jgi:hypothetical protein